MHDPRVGRFFATDPLAYSYPQYSPYSFSGNKVIKFLELEGQEEGSNLYDFNPRDYGLELDQIWDRAVDGAGNIIIGTLLVPVGEKQEGQLIRKFISKNHKLNIPETVTDKQLGESFNFKKRDRKVVVEADKGILGELLDLTASGLDVAGIIPGKGGVFMAVKVSPLTANSLSSIIRGLKISSRTRQILDEFVDVGGQGTFRQVEAEGIAIFEETFQTTARAIRNTDTKAGDFIVTSGKYQGKSVDLVSAVDHPKFDTKKFIKSIDEHFEKDGVDFINVDIRNLDDAGKDLVKKHISNLSESNKAKTILTE
ncbi:hypothetical protein QLS71_008000 [Mariniflexile litorale]|uniref:CdiA C-terminal tRNase domain-containing protein n=1 Tax=Mariniflexile litorale TaxID=3045158 RepID=A0AAU7EL85_9FLAO|nr:hypothetical protein [Mariniflexile sp. KMM 9835]MDQ8213275.1 hypothetical protein [Mariniflexile sp. KMM 9835]